MIIRVHCFVSCLCDILRRHAPWLDERPLYFGVWDADFAVTEQGGLSYHCPELGQSFLRKWFERLYGPEVISWYDHTAAKEQNLESLAELLSTSSADTEVLVMLDLHALPERENKYNQDPFPHYVILQHTSNSDIWLMRDPDFSWEGTMSKYRIADAIRRPSVAGGFILHANSLRFPERDEIRSYFDACLLSRSNPFTEAIRSIVETHLAKENLHQLGQAVREMPVLSVRKYAYEHGFAFFLRALNSPTAVFDAWCETVDTLVKTYTTIHYQIIKLSVSGQSSLQDYIFSLLDQQDALEYRIKRGLQDLYTEWVSCPADQVVGAVVGTEDQR